MPRTTFRCFVTGWLVAAALGQDTPAVPAAGAALGPRVDAYLAAMSELGLFSGAVLLARDGVVVERACGMADHEGRVPNTAGTRFKLMSVSKTFTGVAVLQLVEAGKLRLEDPVGRHVPDWPELWDAVTVHDLLDHTSGIPNLDVPWSRATGEQRAAGDGSLTAIWRAFAPTASRSLLAEPGRSYAYSNFNTILAGLVAELVAAEPYPELVRARILGPAGLADTGFDDGRRHEGLAVGCFLGGDGGPEASEQDMGLIQPAGGYWSTVGDLYRFDRALRGELLLGEAARRTLVTPRGEHTYGYACCFSNTPIHGRACVHHSGGANGYVADFLRFVDDDACVVVLSNYAYAPIGRLSRDLAAMLFGIDVDLPAAVDGRTLDACAGVHPDGEGYRVLRRCGGALVVFGAWPRTTRAPGQLLVPLGGDRFKASAGDAVVEIVNGDGGRELVVGPRRLPRAAVVPDWEEVVGTWHREGGGAMTIAREGGVLRARSTALWPVAAEVMPLAADVGLLLVMPTLGVVVRLQDGVLRYEGSDGRTVELRRR